MSAYFEGVPPEQLINSFHRFGRFGPVYQVLGIAGKTSDGKILMRIHVFETDEYIEYPASDILKDPVEE